MDQEKGLANGQAQQVTFFKDASIDSPKVLGDGSRIGFLMYRLNTTIKVADSSSPQESRSLVRCGTYSPPELSPDGQTVYYVNDTPGEEGIYAISRQGGEPQRLTESLPCEGTASPYYYSFDLSPDGRTLAYSAKLGEEHALFTLPVSGGEPQLLTRFERRAQRVGTLAQWSPDGSQLAYADGNDLYVIIATGGQPRELAHVEYGWQRYSVRWSPDGKFIASLGMLDPNSTIAVFVVPASGGELRQLTFDTTGWKEGLEWHPDSQRLTYYSVMRADSETYQVYLDGRDPTLLVDAPDILDWIGTWAPDGRRYFFLGLAASMMGMYVYNESTGETTLVSDAAETTGVPSWSHDGKTMAWWACRATSHQTWIMENFLPESLAGK